MLRLVLLACAALSAAAATTDPGFDLFLFVRSYSPTFCKETSCSIKPM